MTEQEVKEARIRFVRELKMDVVGKAKKAAEQYHDFPDQTNITSNEHRIVVSFSGLRNLPMDSHGVGWLLFKQVYERHLDELRASK